MRQNSGGQRVHVVGEHRDMAHDMLSVCWTGLLATLHIELGDEAVRGIEGYQLLLQRGQFPELPWVSVLTADAHRATHAGVRNPVLVESG
jgi:hypothetical protein